MFGSPTSEIDLVGLNELTTLDRWALERRARALAMPVYLGGDIMLCRVLGRYKLYVPNSDAGFGVHVMMEGMWESWLTVFMARLIKPGMTVVDVGANHGYYTVLFADLVGSGGAVVALEPHPRTVGLLRQTVFVNGFDDRVEVIEAAAVSADGVTLSFQAPSSEPKNARVVGPEYNGHPDVVSVRGFTLDSLLGPRPRIDFMKIDVEGAEEAAILGAMRIIERDRPDIVLEFNVHRCADPEGLLDSLMPIYGEFRAVTYDSTLQQIDRPALLDRTRTEDWLLYLTANP